MAKKKTVTTGHWLDWRRIKKDKTYPIKIRVTYNRLSKYFDSGESLTKDHYVKITVKGRKLSNVLDTVKTNLEKEIIRAKEVGNSLGDFTWEGFNKAYYQTEDTKPKDLIGVLNEYEKILRSDGRIGSADTYRSTIQSLIYYLQSRGTRNPLVLPFESCTEKFLNNYQRWLLSTGKNKKANSLSTVGYHTRNIRRAWNIGIDTQNLNRELYPFGANKYKIPHPSGSKRSLSDRDLGKLFSYIPVSETEQEYYDFWILSFLLAGANIRDLCQLKYENIIIENTQEGKQFKMVQYTRHKVARTSRKSAQIQIPLKGENRAMVESIIKKWWKGPDGKPSDFVFKILKKEQDPQRQTALIKQFTKMVNAYLGKIADKEKLEERPTSYHARHTFATVMSRQGNSADFIRPLLGHSTVQTTEIYLAGFPDEDVATAMESIIPNNSDQNESK